MSLPIPTHILESVAMCTCILNTYLAARANIWNWLYGIITAILFFIIFLDAKLYADMSAQVIFLFLQIYGIFKWRYGGENLTKLSVTYAARHELMYALISFIVLFIGYAYILLHYTDSTTIYLDAIATALSLVAQWMMGRKWIENWLLWIVMDAVSLKMLIARQLYVTTILYSILLYQSIRGYFIWRNLADNTSELIEA